MLFHLFFFLIPSDFCLKNTLVIRKLPSLDGTFVCFRRFFSLFFFSFLLLMSFFCISFTFSFLFSPFLIFIYPPPFPFFCLSVPFISFFHLVSLSPHFPPRIFPASPLFYNLFINSLLCLSIILSTLVVHCWRFFLWESFFFSFFFFSCVWFNLCIGHRLPKTQLRLSIAESIGNLYSLVVYHFVFQIYTNKNNKSNYKSNTRNLKLLTLANRD